MEVDKSKSKVKIPRHAKFSSYNILKKLALCVDGTTLFHHKYYQNTDLILKSVLNFVQTYS